MVAGESDVDVTLRVEVVAERDRWDSAVADGRANDEADGSDRSTGSGGLERKEPNCESVPSVDRLHSRIARLYVRMTVPWEFEPDVAIDESDRFTESRFGEELPMGIRFGLELSSGTKLGLDGRPMGTTFGLEAESSRSSARLVSSMSSSNRNDWGSGDEGSGGTVLTVERTRGKTITSSSSASSSSSSSSAPVAVALPFPRSLDLSPSSSADKATDPTSPWRSSCSSVKTKDCVREDRLEVGSSPQT
jgi:hypothetical protein